MMRYRRAFTLIEVLISIALLGLILPALYSSIDLLQDSNTHLYDYVQKTKREVHATEVLYLDIASSDGNLTLKNGEFDHICIENTKNSLYGIPNAKVCWVVLKKGHSLIRAEGYRYHLPLKSEEEVEADLVMKDIELFDIYWEKDRVLVFLKQKGEDAVSFMVQGITKPKPKPKKKKKRQQRRKKRLNVPKDTRHPSGTPTPPKSRQNSPSLF